MSDLFINQFDVTFSFVKIITKCNTHDLFLIFMCLLCKSFYITKKSAKKRYCEDKCNIKRLENNLMLKYLMILLSEKKISSNL